MLHLWFISSVNATPSPRDDWQEGVAQAQRLFEHMDLELIEEIGRTAGFTSKRPPRNYASVYDEHDGADAGLGGEVLRRFIRGWREIGGDRRRINILAHEGGTYCCTSSLREKPEFA